MTNRRSIGMSTLMMAVATLFSRVAGLVRDVMVARMFGAGLVTDAFFMAFTIPNLLRRFFAEGSLSAAFVPVFSEVYHLRGEGDAQRLANRCLTLLVAVMIIVVAGGMLFSPVITGVIGFGFSSVPGKLELTDILNRIMFPYIALVSLLALITGILNVRGHFFWPSLSPLFLNLSMISSALFLGHLFERPIYALAAGVLIGGLLQLVIQVPVLSRYQITLRPDFGFWKDPQVRKITALMLPGIAGVAIYQINIIVSRLLASFLPEGSVSYLYYGQRLFEFPQGIFIVSLAQAALPMMSRQVAEDNMEGVRDSLGFSLSLITIFTLPAIAGLILCARPIYALFFYGGAFDRTALANTALALVCYAPGLLFVGYSRICAQTFYALKDTRTPVQVSFWTLLVNAGAGLALMKPFGFVGLALALTLSSAFNALALVFLLKKHVGGFLKRTFWKPVVRVLPACLAMGMAVYALLSLVDWHSPERGLDKWSALGGAVTVGAGVFFAACHLFGVEEIRLGFNLLRSKTTPRGE